MFKPMMPFTSPHVIREMTTLMEMSYVAQSAAAVTIASRMMIMSNPVMMFYADKRDDPASMVAEKFQAVMDGAMAASVEGLRVAQRAAMGNFTAHDAVAGSLSVMNAGLRPAARKVKHNARRLTGL